MLGLGDFCKSQSLDPAELYSRLSVGVFFAFSESHTASSSGAVNLTTNLKALQKDNMSYAYLFKVEPLAKLA